MEYFNFCKTLFSSADVCNGNLCTTNDGILFSFMIHKWKCWLANLHDIVRKNYAHIIIYNLYFYKFSRHLCSNTIGNLGARRQQNQFTGHHYLFYNKPEKIEKHFIFTDLIFYKENGKKSQL